MSEKKRAIAASRSRGQQPIAPNPLDIVPKKNSVRCAVWSSDITRTRPGRHQCRSGRGQETRLENKRRRGRLRRQPRCLPTDGWRDACLNSDRPAQGAGGRDLPPPNQVFENGIQINNLNYLMTLDGIVASRGGIPLVEHGELIGAIGCSGGTNSQDEVVCRAGAAERR